MVRNVKEDEYNSFSLETFRHGFKEDERLQLHGIVRIYKQKGAAVHEECYRYGLKHGL